MQVTPRWDPDRDDQNAVRPESVERELHDVVVPQLFVLTTGLELLRRESDPAAASKLVVDLALTAERALADLRAVSRGERLDWGGSVAEVIRRLSDWLRRMQRVSGVSITVIDEVDPGDSERPIDGDLEYDLRAVVGEALANSVRHGEADRVVVDLLLVDSLLTVRISDNGAWAIVSPGGTGLASLRCRAERWGGSFELCRDRDGTTLTWSAALK